MPKGTCTIDGCEKRRKYRLYCGMHQARIRETGDPGPTGEKVMPRSGACSVDECSKPIRSRGLCESHYDRWRRRGTTDPYVRVVRPCVVEECGEDAQIRDMCRKHYARWRRHGSTDLPVRKLNRDQPCAVDACDRMRYAGLYCDKHAKRLRAYGDPLGVAPPRPPVDEVELFWSNVSPGPPDECWPWEGPVNPQGYGIYSIKRVQYKAHRLACSIGLGRKMSPDKMACHRCSNPICVNPSHLYEGDAYTNATDMVAAGRSARGERSGVAKLQRRDVQEIRRAMGRATAQQVANRFGVSASCVRHIWSGVTWAWLPWEVE